jgi:hypothetical protein
VPPADNPQDQRQDLCNESQAGGEGCGLFRGSPPGRSGPGERKDEEDQNRGRQEAEDEQEKGPLGDRRPLLVIRIVHRSDLHLYWFSMNWDQVQFS